MKIYIYFLGLTFSTFALPNLQAQDNRSSTASQHADSTGLPGDNFSLAGALEMFKKAGSPEDFEKLINTEGNNVNNLDINEDGEIDYVRVIDNIDKDVHAFVLQVAVSGDESQDIAVVELEKTGDETAIVQIVGDEDIYGEQTIVEPDSGDENAFINEFDNNTTASSGPNAGYSYPISPAVINVWLWPTVRYVYAPGYTVYRSPWGWRHHPGWWKPWRPLRWHVFHPLRSRYHRSFVVVRTHRVFRAHRVYTPIRRHSVAVRTRHAASVNNYRVTRTKTTITGPRGNSATRKTTTVRGRNGKVKATRTTTKRRRG
ncbi:MAG: hypothetical protein ACXWV2_02595 [Chitinophagaceae bacterium]